MLFVYRSAWIHSIDLHLHGYTFFHKAAGVRQTVTGFYEKLEYELERCKLTPVTDYVHPVHGMDNSIRIDRVKLPRTNPIADALELTKETDSGIFVSRDGDGSLWREACNLRVVSQRYIRYDLPKAILEVSPCVVTDLRSWCQSRAEMTGAAQSPLHPAATALNTAETAVPQTPASTLPQPRHG